MCRCALVQVCTCACVHDRERAVSDLIVHLCDAAEASSSFSSCSRSVTLKIIRLIFVLFK